MHYQVRKYDFGDTKYVDPTGRRSWYEVSRTWCVDITFDAPVSSELLELVESCLPTRTEWFNGEKIGWFRYERLPRQVSLGTVYLKSSTTITFEIDMKGSYTYRPTDSALRRQFLENLGQELVRLQACSCGQMATV